MSKYTSVFLLARNLDGESIVVQADHSSQRYVRFEDFACVEKEAAALRDADRSVELSKDEARVSAQLTAIKSHLRAKAEHGLEDQGTGKQCPCTDCQNYRAITKILEAEPPVV